MSEYSEVLEVLITDDQEISRILSHRAAQKPLSVVGEFKLMDKHKILDVSLQEGDVGGSRNTGPQCKVVIGVFYEPYEFLAAALKCTHPFDEEVRLPPKVATAMANMATLGPSGVIKARRVEIDWWTVRRDQLASAEAKVHCRLHSDVESVVADKQYLLFKEMLTYIDYDDVAVADLLLTGIKIVGTLPRVGIWRPTEGGEAKLGLKSLLANAAFAQEDAARPRKARAEDVAIWEATLAEKELGCLSGPFSATQLSEEFGKFWIPARRFPGPKNRPIDDFSQYSVNAAFGTEEKVTMLGLDHVVGWSRAWVASRKSAGVFDVCCTSGKRVGAQLSPEWGDGWTDLLGRVTDLKSAYKQLARNPAHAFLSVVAVLDPQDEQIKFFKARSLMFGETAAVYGFLRFSRALATLACCLLNVVSVEFFDDFSQIEPRATAESAQWAMESLLKLLGWRIADSEAKRIPFAEAFVSLGVNVNYEQVQAGTILVEHKPGRIAALEAQVAEAVSRGKFGFRDALSVRGRILFAEGQIFNRVAAPILHMLSRWGLKLPSTQPWVNYM